MLNTLEDIAGQSWCGTDTILTIYFHEARTLENIREVIILRVTKNIP